MRKKPTWILVAFLANLALLPLVVAPEGRAQGRGEPLYDCCKKTPSGNRYCCEWCCVFTWNCKNDEMCNIREGP